MRSLFHFLSLALTCIVQIDFASYFRETLRKALWKLVLLSGIAAVISSAWIFKLHWHLCWISLGFSKQASKIQNFLSLHGSLTCQSSGTLSEFLLLYYTSKEIALWRLFTGMGEIFLSYSFSSKEDGVLHTKRTLKMCLPILIIQTDFVPIRRDPSMSLDQSPAQSRWGLQLVETLKI